MFVRKNNQGEKTEEIGAIRRSQMLITEKAAKMPA
jgi:hypothetical protein